MLDWGCGTAEYRPLIAGYLGHRYVGVDATGTGADVLADLHSLPFCAASMDHVITNAVLEHLANPFLAVREVYRVLKPGGVFSGSVAFLEPYHYRSKFHLSPDGVALVLRDAGFTITGLWPQENWNVFDSLAVMPGPVSAPTRMVLRLLARFERLIRTRYLHPRDLRRWLHRKPPDLLREELMTIGGQIDFLAAKPPPEPVVASGQYGAT